MFPATILAPYTEMNNEHNTLAPVVIFVYNRLKNTRQVVEALQANHLAPQTDVFVYSDAPKDERAAAAVGEVRAYLKTVSGFKSFNVIERPVNYYIEKNITEGVKEIINKFGRIIVLEDDGVTAKNFLNFMNDSLNFYDQHKRVMHIATFTFIDMPAGFNKTFLWRYSENTGGGWATWKDRWEKFVWFQSEAEGLSGLTDEHKHRLELEGDFQCLGALKLKPIPWDICWYVAIIKNNGLAVNSPRALVKNNGLFNGTHLTPINRILGKHQFDVELDQSGQTIVFEDNIVESAEAMAKLKEFYRSYGKRKRDKVLNFFVRILVTLRITKLAKRLLR